MPIALGSATKIIPALMSAGKEYVCVMRLHGDFDLDELKRVVREFVGPIYQRPPLRSAVKRVVRIRRVYYIKILEVSGRDVLMRIGVEAGTYIRKLCHDIGEILGCGAHMQELRRTRVGPLKEDETLVTLQDVLDAYKIWTKLGEDKYLRRVILPVEIGVSHLPKVVIKDSAVDAICHGASLAVTGILRVETGIKVGNLIALFTQKGELVALGKATMRSEEMISSQKGIAVKVTRVIMRPGTYPPVWKIRKKTH